MADKIEKKHEPLDPAQLLRKATLEYLSVEAEVTTPGLDVDLWARRLLDAGDAVNTARQGLENTIRANRKLARLAKLRDEEYEAE